MQIDNDLRIQLNKILEAQEEQVVELQEIVENNHLSSLNSCLYDLEQATVKLREETSEEALVFNDMPFNSDPKPITGAGISVNAAFSDLVFRLELPVLAVHRKAKQKEKMLFYRSLKGALEAFSADCDYDKLRNAITDNAVIVVIHHYPAGAVIRDNDNMELKAVVDLLHMYGILTSDSGDRLSTFQTTVPADHKHTEILVMSREVFDIYIREALI